VGLGLLIQGGAATGAFPAWDLAQLRYCGVLQRIALCFALVSVIVLYLPQTPNPRLQVALPLIPNFFTPVNALPLVPCQCHFGNTLLLHA